MTLVLNGSVGVSDVDGSAATPAIRGTDANTGMFFPAADTIAFAEGGVEAMRLDSSGNVGIGTSSPSYSLHVNRTGAAAQMAVQTNTTAAYVYALYGSTVNTALISDATTSYLSAETNNALVFRTDATERARIDASGIFTAPYQTAFNAYGGGTQSFGGAQSTVVVQFNVQNSLGVRSTGYNTSTYRFTAPVSGAYLLCGRIVNTTSGSTGPELIFRVNGSSTYYAAINYANNSYVTTSGQVVVYLTASDYVEACITNNNSTSFTLDLTRSNFCGFLIG
jgi:hypothetical protein